MKYVPPLGLSGDASYENFNPQAGVDGSIVPAEAIEHPQREIINAIKAAGLNPSATDLTQLSQLFTAIKNSINTVENNVEANILKPATKTKLGGVMVGNGLTVNVAGLLALLLASGSGLEFDGAGRLTINPAAWQEDFIKLILQKLRLPFWLAGAKTWYVNASSGNDSNDGSTPDKAFATLQAAVNYVSANWNLGPYVGTINAVGNFGPLSLPKYNSSTGYMRIVGSGVGSCVLSATDTATITTISGSGRWDLSSLTVNNIIGPVSSTNKRCVYAVEGSTLNLSDCNISSTENTDAVGSGVLLLTSGGSIRINSGVTMSANGRDSGSGLVIMYIDNLGRMSLNNNCTINGRANLIVRCDGSSIFARSVTGAPTISGSVTGKRYQVGALSLIRTNGGGPDFFPGSIAGTTDPNGGYYV